MNLSQRQLHDLIKTAQLLTGELIDQTAIGPLTPKERLRVIRHTAYQIDTVLEILKEKAEKPEEE